MRTFIIEHHRMYKGSAEDRQALTAPLGAIFIEELDDGRNQVWLSLLDGKWAFLGRERSEDVRT